MIVRARSVDAVTGPVRWTFCLLAAACAAKGPSVSAGAEPRNAAVTSPRPALATTASDRCARGLTNLVRSLDQPLRIRAYVTRGLPELDSFVAALGKALEALKNADPRAVDYAIVETKDDATKAEARVAGLDERPLVATSEETEGRKGFMGLVLSSGRSSSVLKLTPSDRADQTLVFWLGRVLHELRDHSNRVHHSIGLLVRHDEVRLSESNLVPASAGTYSARGIIETNFEQYAFREVDLRGGQAAIPDDLEGLVVTQPGADLSETELRRIDQFVMKGKSLAVFAGAVNLRPGDATMSATLSTHGLERLLAGYGIDLGKDVLVDLEGSYRMTLSSTSGPVHATFPTILDVQHGTGESLGVQRLDTTFAPFFAGPELAVPFASTLSLAPGRQPRARARVVMRSSPTAVQVTGNQVDLAPLHHPWAHQIATLPRRPFAVAAEVDGFLRSAFLDTRDVDTPAESVREGQVFVLASPQFLANPFARAGNPADPTDPAARADDELLLLAGPYAQTFVANAIVVLKGTLDWMTMDHDLLECAEAF
jgi:hypothetical protein